MEPTPFNASSGRTRAEIALLLDFYGNALTERQRRAAELYFQEDLTLAEIADLTGITRQGVRDGLKKAEKALYSLEEKLGIAERFRRQKKALTEAKALVHTLPDGDTKTRLTERIEAAIAEE